jgi:small neutral amino acid transporter SnatA (MarC family)
MIEPIVATIIVAITLILILTHKLGHTIAAMIGATAMMIAGRVLGFYSEELAIEAVEFEAIGLLLGNDPGIYP